MIQTYIVKEPDESNNEETPPIVANDKAIRNPDMLHGLALELFWLL
jgi:hypothetical protein